MKQSMKHSVGVAIAIALTAMSGRAADWTMIAGSEEGRAEVPIAPVVFTQIVAQTTPWAVPVDGLQSPALSAENGEAPSFNIDGPLELTVRRARLGARGTVPNTQRAVSWFVAVDAGRNAATRGLGINLLDASVSIHAVPAVRLRIGQFKLPTMDETLEANPVTADAIDFSPLVLQLMLEQPIKDGAFAGPAFANRDIGVQAFNSHLLPPLPLVGEHLEVSWALMLSQGQAGGLDPDVHKDVTGRVMLSWVPNPASRFRPGREELSVFAWRLQGRRVVDDPAAVDAIATADVDRIRQGIGLHARLFGARARVEIVAADGVLFTGQNPAFDGQPLLVDPTGTAMGFTVDIAAERLGPFELDARLEQLHRYKADDPRARVLRNVVIGAQYKWTENMKLMLSYAFRHVEVGAEGPADARIIADSIGDLVSAQVTMAL